MTCRSLPLDFQPPSIPNLAAWFAADRVLVSHGAALRVWPDISGQGNHALQDDFSKRPVLYNNVLSQPALVYFDGSDDAMETVAGAVAGNAPHTLFVAAQQTNTGINAGVVTYGTQGAGLSTSTIGNLGGLWYGGQNTVGPIGSSLPSALSVLSKTYDSATGTLTGFFNGAQDAQITQTYNIGTSNLALGVFYHDYGRADAYVGEAIIYNRCLSDFERKMVERYLGRRWNVVVSS